MSAKCKKRKSAIAEQDINSNSPVAEEIHNSFFFEFLLLPAKAKGIIHCINLL